MEGVLTAEDFRKRSHRLRVQAWIILFFVFVLLAFAVYFFLVGATNLTIRDTVAAPEFSSSADVRDVIAKEEATLPKKPVFDPSPEVLAAYSEQIAAIHQSREEFFATISEISRSTRTFDDNQTLLNRENSDGGSSSGSRENDRDSTLPGQTSDSVALDKELNLDRNLYAYRSELTPDVTVEFSLIDWEWRGYYSETTKSSVLVRRSELFAITTKMLSSIRSANELWKSTALDFSNQTIAWEASILPARERIARLRQREERISELEIQANVDTIGASQNRGDQEEISTTFLVQTNVTRFGAMLVIIFFVGILVNLYRYLMRLSAYYEARGDILAVTNVATSDPAKLSALVSLFSPENYDFGRPPKSPSEQAVELTKTILEKSNKIGT